MNQAKLRQFENFNFENNVVWKEYIKEIDPSVPKERIEKLKKIWYKDNIDPDFDPEFKGNATSSQNQQSTSNQNLQYQQQSTTYKIRYELENFLKVGFILTAVLGISISSKIAFIICVLILYRQEHTPQWSKEYAKKVLSREYGQNIIFLTGFFFIGPFRIFYNLPLIIHFWIGITEYLNIKRGTLYNILKKYVDETKSKQAYLINLKYQIEIALLPFSIVLWFLGQSSFLTIMFIGNFLRVKYLLNNQFQYQCYYVNTQYLEPHKSKPVIGFIITKVQQISRYLTKVR